MAEPRIPMNATGAFWEWLRRERPEAHLLYEVWLALRQVSDLKAGMTSREKVLLPSWLKEVGDSLPVNLRPRMRILDGLFREQEKREKENEGERLGSGSSRGKEKEGPWDTDLRREVRVKLNPLIDELWKEYVQEHPEAPSVGGGVSGVDAVPEATVRRLALLRKEQRTTLMKRGPGRFWHIDAAIDGAPFTLLTTSPTTRPSATSAKLAEGKGGEGKVAAGTWVVWKERVYVEMQAGSKEATKTIGESLKRTVIAGTPPEATDLDVEGSDEAAAKLMNELASGRDRVLRSGRGYFWFAAKADRAKGGPLLLVASTPDRTIPRLFGTAAMAHGPFTWDQRDKVVTLQASGGSSSDRSLLQALVKYFADNGLSTGSIVDVFGRGVELRGERPETDADPTMAAFLAKVRALHATNQSEARARSSGKFWFAQIARNGDPLLVLHHGNTLPVRPGDLLREDALSRSRVAEGSWTRGTNEVTLTFQGSPAPAIKTALSKLLTQARYFYGMVKLA